MNEEEQEHLTRKDTRSNRRNDEKMNRILNRLIVLVSIGIVIALVVIFTTDDSKDQAEPTEKEPTEKLEQPQPTPEPVPAPVEDSVAQEPTETQEPSEEPTQQENSVESSEDAAVKEVWTNETWTPYPTEQTGAHASTYEVGHIDYEEKLKAFYSVIPMEQDKSIIWSVKNNGSATTSIAVLSSNDQSAIYRVAIEWVDGEGWLPVQVEVLNTLP